MREPIHIGAVVEEVMKEFGHALGEGCMIEDGAEVCVYRNDVTTALQRLDERRRRAGLVFCTRHRGRFRSTNRKSRLRR